MNSFVRLVRRFLFFLDQRNKTLLIFAFLAGFGLFLSDFVFAFGLRAFLAQIGGIDKTITKMPAWLPIDTLLTSLLVIFFAGTFRGLMQWAQFYMQGNALENVRLLIRKRALVQVFFSDEVSTDRTLRYFNERSSAVAGSMMGLQGGLMQITAASLLLVSMIYLSLELTLLSLVVLVILGLPVKRFDKKIAEAGEGLASELAKVESRAISGIKNLLLLQIYGTRELEHEKAESGLERHFNHVSLYYLYTATKVAVPQILGIVLVCVITIAVKNWRLLATEDLITYFYLFVRFVQMFADLFKTTSSWALNKPQLEEILDWWGEVGPDLESRVKKTQANASSNLTSQFKSVGWKVEHVTFRYPGTNRDVLLDLSFDLPPKQTLVILGPSGSGKSTLLQLMLGVSVPTLGAVSLYDENKKIAIEELRPSILSSFGYVGPDPFIVEGSIYENLVYGLYKTPTQSEVSEAIELAQCQFAYSMKGGLEHLLTEQGTGLSAGQKQRLALARALLRRPKALFLDEATSNLDRDTESRLIKSLEEIKGRTTLIVVTHRESLLTLADQTLRLEER